MSFVQYKRIWYFIFKLSVVSGAGYYVYRQAFVNPDIAFPVFLKMLQEHVFRSYYTIPVILAFTFFNWFFEILKWKTLANTVFPVSFSEAVRQSLGSHTLSLLTPFKSGEYFGKAVFYPGKIRKKILFLNFIGNAAQLFITLVFGVAGIYFLATHYRVKIHLYKIRRWAAWIGFFLIAVLGGGIRYGQKEPFYAGAFRFYQKTVRKVSLKIVFYAWVRYILFSHQFYFLLLVFGVKIPYDTALMLLFSMYVLATFVPAIHLFDFVIKGSVALYLFSFEAVPPVIIFAISLLMWLLNFVLPAIIGSYYVLIFKKEKT